MLWYARRRVVRCWLVGSPPHLCRPQMASERGAINGYMVLDAEEGKVISSGTFTLNPLTTITWAGFSTYNVRLGARRVVCA